MKSTKPKIYPQAKIVGNMDNFLLGDFSQIDDFCFLNIGKSLSIGKFVHLSSFVSIIGGGKCEILDFAGLSAGCRVVTGSDDFSGGFLTNPTVPSKYKNTKEGIIRIGKHALLGTNVVILPDVEIGAGTIIGAGAIVNKDLESWSIYAGFNPRKIGERDRDSVISKEIDLLKNLENI